MRQHCAQCLTEVLAGGYDTPTGETLCGPCYFALWGPRVNGNRLASASERARPLARRAKNGRPVWIPGPTAQLDPREPAGAGVWRRRR